MNATPPPSRLARPSPAGIYDYLLGGHHYCEADREAAEKALALAPEARFAARENRAFLDRATRYVAERGVRQYIDIGSGFPTIGPVHEIAAETIAGPHVVYVDYDPSVTAVSCSLLKSPNVIAVAHDVRHPSDIINDPAAQRLIDWSQPIALVMAAILHFVTDQENPAEIIAAFRDLMAPGSYLILSHAAHGENPDAAEEASRAWDKTGSAMNLRTPRELEDLFTGFELTPPGLVTTTEWGTSASTPTGQALMLAGVGRVP